MSEPPSDLQERLARLEAQVAYLLTRIDPPAPERPAPERPAPAQPPPFFQSPPPPRSFPAAPVPRPPAPAGPARNPILLVASAGAGLFLIGAVYFLRWSIQQGWIGPEIRFLLGLLAGIGLAAVAVRQLLGRAPKLGVALLLAGLGTLMLTLRWGAFEYHFFPPALGLAGIALAVLLAGALAARARSQGALTAALGMGLIAPLVFSQGGHHEVVLAIYLAAVMAAALLVPYLTGTGARWQTARWLAVLGTWLLLLPVCDEVLAADAASVAGLLALHLLLAGTWAWLPRQAEHRPGTPTLLWAVPALIATGLGWLLWRKLAWPETWYVGPVLALATLHLLLVKPVRQRLGSRQADPGLLALAVGHLALAMAIALEARWLAPAWALLALGAAWALERGETGGAWAAAEGRWFRLLATALAVLAALTWAVDSLPWLFRHRAATPVFNPAFLAAILTAGAWALLARRDRNTGLAGFIGLQLVANLAVAIELGRLAEAAGGSARMAAVVFTLVLALTGAWQWLWSRRQNDAGRRRGLALAGYGWLGFAACKLLLVDLANVETPLRALAALGVGGIFLAAALAANRAPAKEDHP